jgi:hypothetical protein
LLKAVSKNAKDRFASFIKTGGKEIQDNKALFILVKAGQSINNQILLSKKTKNSIKRFKYMLNDF